MRFKVIFKEEGKAPQERWCDVPSEQEVVRIYGLDEEDIEYYSIKRIHDGTKRDCRTT
jgi:hypothetical protein